MKFNQTVDRAYVIVSKHKEGVTIYQLAYWLGISVPHAYYIIRTLEDVYGCVREGSKVRCKEEEGESG